MSAARSSRSARSSRAPRAAGEDAAPTQPRTGARRTVMHTIKQIPAYLKLLGGLLTDRRVSAIDKLLVAGAIVYIVSPLDLIPDFIPFLGEVDDIYFLMLALQRLVANAGMQVLVDHWAGDPEELSDLSVQRAFSAAAFFLPGRIRRSLQRMASRKRFQRA